MLSIFFGEPASENYICNPDAFFDNQHEADWLTEEETRQMVKDIDQSEVVGPNLIQSPFLGPIPPERLSGGVKTLIMIAHDGKHLFNASACGDNCAKWLLKIGSKSERLIRLGYIMDFGSGDFVIRIENTGHEVRNMAELTDEVVKNRLL